MDILGFLFVCVCVCVASRHWPLPCRYVWLRERREFSSNFRFKMLYDEKRRELEFRMKEENFHFLECSNDYLNANS